MYICIYSLFSYRFYVFLYMIRLIYTIYYILYSIYTTLYILLYIIMSTNESIQNFLGRKHYQREEEEERLNGK